MSLLYYGTSASNGFDADGHYVRTEPLVGGCTTYVKKVVSGCPSRFGKVAIPTAASDVGDAVAQHAVASTPKTKPAVLSGLLNYLIGRRG
jgi:hypothetical protein